MLRSRFSAHRAYTLVELMIATLLLATVSVVSFGFLRSGTELFTKNTALNRSHSSMRSLVDQLSDTLQTAENVPTLMDASGVAVTASGVPAAGIFYDRFIAEPYLLSPAASSLAANATSLQVEYPIRDPGSATNSLANRAKVPDPQVGDLLAFDTPTGEVRARITAVNNPTGIISTTPPHDRVTLTFAAAIGKAVTWTATQPVQARLIRREAFLVVPSTSGGNEMRHYPQFDPVPALNIPANYTVISNQLTTDAADATPFRLVEVDDDRWVEVTLRTRLRDGYDWLASRQKGGFNNYAAVNMRLTSRLHARTQSAQ